MLKKIYLHHFRNYTRAEFTFSPGVNWITGKNGQGKTNLLEAIYFLSTGRSYRTHQLSQLIQKGASFFYLEAEIEKEGVLQTLKLSFNGERKNLQHNANHYPHFTPLIGLMPHVLYAPENIALVSGMPAFRRKFLNIHLAQISPLYLHHLARYHKAMRQRNELLRRKTEEAIDPWEETMAQSAHFLMEKRKQMVSELELPLQQLMQNLSSGEDRLKMVYESSLPLSSKEELLKHWQKNRKKELYLGSTLYGPHRDDILFSIGDLSAKTFASEGQKHSILAALHLSSWEHIQKQTNELPLMTIDDFGSHLDQKRQENFQEKLSGLGQIFLSSPHLLPNIFPHKQIVEIEAGKMSAFYAE